MMRVTVNHFNLYWWSRYLKAKLKAVTAELETCVQVLREKETMLNEQTKLRAELEATNIKSSTALASLKTKMDKMKHELDEKNKQASSEKLRVGE